MRIYAQLNDVILVGDIMHAFSEYFANYPWIFWATPCFLFLLIAWSFLSYLPPQLVYKNLMQGLGIINSVYGLTMQMELLPSRFPD
jgi:hypothetical protein